MSKILSCPTGYTMSCPTGYSMQWSTSRMLPTDITILLLHYAIKISILRRITKCSHVFFHKYLKVLYSVFHGVEGSSNNSSLHGNVSRLHLSKLKETITVCAFRSCTITSISVLSLIHI